MIIIQLLRGINYLHTCIVVCIAREYKPFCNQTLRNYNAKLGFDHREMFAAAAAATTAPVVDFVSDVCSIVIG